MTLAVAFVWKLFYLPQLPADAPWWGNELSLAMVVLIYLLLTRVYDAFLVVQSRVSELIGSQFLSALISDVFAYGLIALLINQLPSVLPMVLAAAIQLVIAAVWSFCANWAYDVLFPPKKVIVVYQDEKNMENLIRDYGLERRFHVIRSVAVERCLNELDSLGEAEVLFLSNVHSHDRNIILKYCVDHGIAMYVVPRIGDVIMSGAAKMHMFHLPFLCVGRYYPPPEFVVGKRLFDVVVSMLGLVILSPIMIISAIAVKACDGGPVFYRQKRLTKDGNPFHLLKFRSMHINAEANGVARLSSGENDPRITPVGRVLRKYRIDELPQLLNVLVGTMSIVGPRPERPEIAEQYERILPEFHLRLQAKAGITGYAQVYGKYNSRPYDKLKMDLMYIANPSLIEDLKICFLTLRTIFTPESTEGIEDGEVTALDRELEEENDLITMG